jgi:aromatic ring-opening dioxygenase catalytic subunit (LigB family)
VSITRRTALATAAALAACRTEKKEQSPVTTSSNRMPAVFLPHGGGPWPFVEMGFGKKEELTALATYLRSVKSLPKTEPVALLVVSAHWEESVPTVMTNEKPPMLYDYYGFPPESYEIQWPAPGHRGVAARVRELLGGAGFQTAEDSQRGFDHGTFVPLKLTYPDADVPTVQLSLKKGLDPAEHLAMGRALAPLRDEGVFIVGSGMSYHNMRGFNDPRAAPHSETFDAWLRDAATLEPAARDAKLAEWAKAPASRLCHPREEHLLPLMVIAGAAGGDRGVVAYNGTITGLRLSAYHYG